MDLNGMPVAKAKRPIPVPEDADAVIQTAAELIDQLLRESGIPLHRVLGVGVGVRGFWTWTREGYSFPLIFIGRM